MHMCNNCLTTFRYLCDYRLGVSLVDPQCYNGDVKRFLGAAGRSELLVGDVACLAHDHTHGETWGLLGSRGHHHLGE